MPKYILHIGPPKSGSKYIQSQLFHSRAFLATNGVLYPENWRTRPDKIWHDAVRDGLREGKDLKADFDDINAKRAEKVILTCETCEAFDGLKLPELERLREYIGPNPVEVVFYARRWSDRVPSDWRQRVMMGQYITFPEFYVRFLSNPEGTGEFNYSIVWDNYAKIFGRESLRIVSFSNLIDHNVDLFDHFCRAILGLKEAPQVEKGLIQKNAGPNMIDTEILRDLNYLYYIDTSRIDHYTRVKFDRLKNKYDLSALTGHLQSDMREIKLKDNAVPLRTTWERVSAYRDRLVSPEYGKEIFERRDVDVNFVSQNYLFRPGVMDEVRNLYRFISSEHVDAPDLQGLQANV